MERELKNQRNYYKMPEVNVFATQMNEWVFMNKQILNKKAFKSIPEAINSVN